MRESIRGYADAVFEAAAAEGRAQQLAGELAAVVALVGSSPDLLGALSDPGVPARRRRAVLTDLLGSRLSADTVGLVGHAVESDRAPEAVANLAWLARVAAGGELAEGGAGLGRLAARERIDGYATAVLGPLASLGGLNAVEEEVFRFARIVDGSEALRAVLTDLDVPPERRSAIVSDLLTGRTNPASVRVVTYAVRVARARDLLGTLTWLVERVAEESDRRVAEVRSAVALDDDQRGRLGRALGRITGRTVEVRVAVAPELLGGFVAAVGDTLVDGSVRHRLDLLRERITLPEVEIPVGPAGSLPAGPGQTTNDQSTTRES